MRLTKINDLYEIFLPDHRADRPEWTSVYGWEKKRIAAMVETITKDDTVFYIGVEVSDIAAILVKEINCDIVFFEPNHKVFPTIKTIWQANQLKSPLDFFKGFVSDKSTITEYAINNSFFDIDVTDMVLDHGFKQLYESDPSIPQTTLDDYCRLTGIYPTIITADIEGAEFSMLRGAENILREKKPLVFLSVHPVFMWEHYKHETGVMLKFMRDLGYEWNCIDYDIHEHHLIFYPK